MVQFYPSKGIFFYSWRFDYFTIRHTRSRTPDHFSLSANMVYNYHIQQPWQK